MNAAQELKGASLPKGMLPFSTDWFMTWQPNIHSSLFHAIYRFVSQNDPGTPAIQGIVKSYLEHLGLHSDEPVLVAHVRGRLRREGVGGHFALGYRTKRLGGDLPPVFVDLDRSAHFLDHGAKFVWHVWARSPESLNQ